MPRDREPSITPYPTGPYLVRGAVRLLDSSGREIRLRRRVIALCRCGRSRLKPLCDGSHALGAEPERRLPD